MARRMISPAALIGVGHVLQSAYPNMSSRVAIDNAMTIIKGLHQQGLDVGPIAAFGPHDATQQPLDALDLAAQMIEKDQGRKPWLPDGMQ